MLKGDKIILLLTLFLFSCETKKDAYQELRYKYKEISDLAAKGEYLSVLKMSNDSANNWIRNGLQVYLYSGSWQIDSLICFNATGDKAVMAISQKCEESKDCVQDEVHYFYGVKIKESWFFFMGAVIVLPREYYKKKSTPLSTPLPFEKLHEIAMEEIFRGYLIKDENGQWQINEKFFERIPNSNGKFGGYGPCFKCQNEDEYYIYLSKLNWISKYVALRKEDVLASYNADTKSLKLRFPLRPYAKYMAPWKVVIKMYKENDPANPIIKYTQSKTDFEETDFVCEMEFENVSPDENLRFSIQIDFSTVGSGATKPLELVIPVSKIKVNSFGAV